MAVWRRLCKAERECCSRTSFLLLLDTFLEHFLELKLCIPYLFLNLRKSGVQCFKRCAIWIWNEEVMIIWKNPNLHLGGWIVLVRNFRITPPLVRNFRTTHPLCEFLNFPCFSQKSPILTPLQTTFKCHCNLYQYTIMAWSLWALSSAAQSGAHSSFL